MEPVITKYTRLAVLVFMSLCSALISADKLIGADKQPSPQKRPTQPVAKQRRQRHQEAIPVFVKALDHPGEYSLWIGGKDRSQPPDFTHTVRGEALHALELIVGDRISSYVPQGERAPAIKPREECIKEARQWWTNLVPQRTKDYNTPADLRQSLIQRAEESDQAIPHPQGKLCQDGKYHDGTRVRIIGPSSRD